MDTSSSYLNNTDLDASPSQSDPVENDPDESNEVNDVDMENDQNDDKSDINLPEEADEEVENNDDDAELADSNPNVPQLRNSTKNKPVKKPVEKKGQKRKSSFTETPAKSKLPKYESVPVVLETKSIYIKANEISKFNSLDRLHLTTAPSKEGLFEVGDLIWAKMIGYPWWPCMISVDPETGHYSRIAGFWFTILFFFV